MRIATLALVAVAVVVALLPAASVDVSGTSKRPPVRKERTSTIGEKAGSLLHLAASTPKGRDSKKSAASLLAARALVRSAFDSHAASNWIVALAGKCKGAIVKASRKGRGKMAKMEQRQTEQQDQDPDCVELATTSANVVQTELDDVSTAKEVLARAQRVFDKAMDKLSEKAVLAADSGSKEEVSNLSEKAQQAAASLGEANRDGDEMGAGETVPEIGGDGGGGGD